MRIHILAICGTFMGGVAILAREAGHAVAGCDANVYPPMSTQLEAAGIALHDGYLPEHLSPAPDRVLVGNVLSRGNPAVEHMLNLDLPYASGPQWLSEEVLRGRHVLAVAGTHGKTTTASILAWILEYAGLQPGFLIGGVPGNFGVSARLGESKFFVVEADEYDSAFFDKRSKFIHYRPRTLVLNNLEFDHADIFDDLAAIQRQFHHLLRIVPGDGLVVHRHDDRNLDETLRMGCWTPCESFGVEHRQAQWRANMLSADGARFELLRADRIAATVQWRQIGAHNVMNAVAAVAAAHHIGVDPSAAVAALSKFQGVKRRLEIRGEVRGVTVYDDFAHHPTAIRATVEALRARIGGARIIAVLEPRSSTMRMGVHNAGLGAALSAADHIAVYESGDLAWSGRDVLQELGDKVAIYDSIDLLANHLAGKLECGDHVVLMSNGSFGGLHDKLVKALQSD